MKLSEYTIKWCEENLADPKRNGKLTLTYEQKSFLRSWFATLPNGEFRYLQGLYRRAKDNGKFYLAAILTLIELCIPYRPYIEESCVKVKKLLSPRIWIYAYSEAQCDNTFEACHDLLTDTAIASELDVGYSRIFGFGGKIIKMTLPL
jgi:hypothetical protein